MVMKESDYNGLRAWLGYLAFFSQNKYFYYKNEKGQRMVTCKTCGVKIPKEIPRFKLSQCWSYDAGHYCLKCGIEKLEETFREREGEKTEITQNLEDMKTLLEVAKKESHKKQYLEVMAVAHMMAKLNPKKDKYY